MATDMFIHTPRHYLMWDHLALQYWPAWLFGEEVDLRCNEKLKRKLRQLPVGGEGVNMVCF